MKNSFIALLLTIVLLNSELSPASAASHDTNPLFEMIETTAKNIKSERFHRNKVAALTRFCRSIKKVDPDYYKDPGLLQIAILYGLPLSAIKLLVEKGADQESQCVVDLTQNAFYLHFSEKSKPLYLNPLELLNILLEKLKKDLAEAEAIPVGTKGFITNLVVDLEWSITEIEEIIEFLDPARKRTMSGKAFAASSLSSESSDDGSSCEDTRAQKKARI